MLLRQSLVKPLLPFSTAPSLEWPNFLRVSPKPPNLSPDPRIFLSPSICNAQGSLKNSSHQLDYQGVCLVTKAVGTDCVDGREFTQIGPSPDMWERRAGWSPASFSASKLQDPRSQGSQLKLGNTRTKSEGRDRRRVWEKGLILDDSKHLKMHLDPPPHPSFLACNSCLGPDPCLGP